MAVGHWKQKKFAPKVSVGGPIANVSKTIVTPDTGAERTACGLGILEHIGIDQDKLCPPTSPSITYLITRSW